MRETASKSGLLLSPCLRWAHPSSKWYSSRPEDSEAREDGKIFHGIMDLHANGLPAAIPAHLRDKVGHAQKYFDSNLLPRSQWIRSEVPMGINFRTGETVLLTGSDRDYPDDDRFFYGTADLVHLLVGGSLMVSDWKTGLGDGAEEQLKSLACMAVRAFSHDGPVRIAALYVDDEGVTTSEREVCHAELADHYDSISNAISEARATPKPSLPVVGGHCSQLYCPHMAMCDATAKDMDGIQNEHGGSPVVPVEWTIQPSGPKHAGLMAVRMKAIKRAIAYYDGHLKDYVRAGGTAVYDGLEWKETPGGFRLGKIK